MHLKDKCQKQNLGIQEQKVKSCSYSTLWAKTIDHKMTLPSPKYLEIDKCTEMCVMMLLCLKQHIHK